MRTKVIAAVIAVAAVPLMAATKCEGTSGSGSGPVIYYGSAPSAAVAWQPLGVAHHGAHRGQMAWVEVGSKMILGALAGAAAGEAAARATGQSQSAVTEAASGAAVNPCYRKPSYHEVGRWEFWPRLQSVTNIKRGKIECADQNDLMKRTPRGSFSDALRCIAQMIASGVTEVQSHGSPMEEILVFHYKDGAVSFNNLGRVITAWPPETHGGGWAECN